jgi:hypothetical protein
MKYKTDEKTRKATRERVKKHREKQTVTEPVTHSNVTITQADFDNLPPSLKFQVEAGTRTRKILKQPLELEERKAQAVRRFRGY